MAAILVTVVLALISTASGLNVNSGVTVRNGIYYGLTVKVEDQVPKHLCTRALNKLEVRAIINQ